jgi:hypothetical protein
LRIIIEILRFLVPFVVLYTIGYYVAGFSALTVSWIFVLSLLIFLGDWLLEMVFHLDRYFGRFHKGIISFLVSAVVIFMITQIIEGGNVPISGALLAAIIIGGLMTLIPDLARVSIGEEKK